MGVISTAALQGRLEQMETDLKQLMEYRGLYAGIVHFNTQEWEAMEPGLQEAYQNALSYWRKKHAAKQYEVIRTRALLRARQSRKPLVSA